MSSRQIQHVLELSTEMDYFHNALKDNNIVATLKIALYRRETWRLSMFRCWPRALVEPLDPTSSHHPGLRI